MKPAIWLWCSLSELTTLWPRAVSAHRPSDLLGVTSLTNQCRGWMHWKFCTLSPKALANWSCFSDHASVVSERQQQTLLKLQQITIHYTEVAKHRNTTYDFRNVENANLIAESSHKWNLLNNAECHRICQSLAELIKSRSVHLNRVAIWTSICKY